MAESVWIALALAICGQVDESPSDEAEAGELTLLRRELSSRLLVDTVFDNGSEDVVEWWNTGKLSLDNRRGPWRAVVEARARWGVVGTDPGRPFLLVNPADRKWTGEADLREAYVQWRRGALELRAGEQIFVWGKNELFAAADLLNPIDLRYDPLAALDSPKDAKAPVFAFDAALSGESLGLELVMLPFFSRNRAFLLGRDFALLPPGSDMERQVRGVLRLDPSVEDQFQEALWGTKIPEEAPEHATWALRGTASGAGIDAAATVIYGWDRTPRLRIDDDLKLLLAASDRILADPQVMFADPVLRTAAFSVLDKARAGEALVRARYRRLWRLALEAQRVFGDFVVRADVGYSPGQTFYTASFLPLWRSTVTSALGVEYMHGDEWYASLTGFGLAVLAAGDERLLGLETSDVDPTARHDAWLYGVMATLRHTWVDDDFEAAATGIYNAAGGDYVATGYVAYSGIEAHTFKLGALWLGGPAGGIGGTFEHNDFIFAAWRVVW